jgi:hypothetical protein
VGFNGKVLESLGKSAILAALLLEGECRVSHDFHPCRFATNDSGYPYGEDPEESGQDLLWVLHGVLLELQESLFQYLDLLGADLLKYRSRQVA